MIQESGGEFGGLHDDDRRGRCSAPRRLRAASRRSPARPATRARRRRRLRRRPAPARQLVLNAQLGAGAARRSSRCAQVRRAIGAAASASSGSKARYAVVAMKSSPTLGRTLVGRITPWQCGRRSPLRERRRGAEPHGSAPRLAAHDARSAAPRDVPAPGDGARASASWSASSAAGSIATRRRARARRGCGRTPSSG